MPKKKPKLQRWPGRKWRGDILHSRPVVSGSSRAETTIAVIFLGPPPFHRIALSYRAHTNKVLAGFHGRLHRFSWGRRQKRKQRDGFGHGRQPTTSEVESVAGGGSARLDPYDLSRFQGERGRAVPEPVAPEPQETIDAAPNSAAKKCRTMNERREHYEKWNYECIGSLGSVKRTAHPSHRLTGFWAKKVLASVWLRATRHGYENQKPKAKANEE